MTYGIVSNAIIASANSAGANAAIAAGYSASVGSAIAGAAATYATSTAIVAGAVAGAVGGAITGGIRGAVVGALSGGLFGFSNSVWSTVSNTFGRGFGEAVSSGLIAGGTSSALGGRFGDGFWLGFGTSASYSIYKAVVGSYDPTWQKGGGIHDKNPNNPGYEPANPGWNNIGVARADITAPLKWYWKVLPNFEGNWLFRGLNEIPGFNSFATLHDWFMNSIEGNWWTRVVNIPSMAPAIAVNYASLLNGPAGVGVIADRAINPAFNYYTVVVGRAIMRHA